MKKMVTKLSRISAVAHIGESTALLLSEAPDIWHDIEAAHFCGEICFILRERFSENQRAQSKYKILNISRTHTTLRIHEKFSNYVLLQKYYILNFLKSVN